MATLHFLGTASALPAADRTNTLLALLPDASGGSSAPGLLIDAGGDVYGALRRAGIALDRLADLFITHAHIDHIGSLPSLLESFRLGGRTAPLRVWALPEVLAVAEKLVSAFDFELTLDRWTYDISFHTVEDEARIRLAGWEARVLRMDHSVPSVGLRLELPGGPLAYTCDTQPTPAIVELGRGARTLITECTFLRAHVAAARATKHMTAYEAGQQATACGVETLALVHLGEGEPGWSVGAARAQARATFSGRVLIPDDLDTLDV